MKILDKYLIKQFLLTIIFGLAAFTLLFVVIDMMENLDDFIDQNVPFQIIILYYLYFIPEIIRLITPVAILFAGLFTIGKMANLNEITAIKSSGISMYRYMTPIVITTIFLSGASIYFGGYVVPKANKLKLDIEINSLKKGTSFSGSNLFFQDAQNRIVNISYFDQSSLSALRASIQEYDSADLSKMIWRLDAARLTFDTLKQVWIGYNGTQREFMDSSDSIISFLDIPVNRLNFRPGDLEFKQKKPDQMNLTDLSRLIDDQQKAGIDPRSVIIDYHSRFAFGFASLVSILFGLPLSANKRRSGLALQFGINILITFIYLGLMKIFEAFGRNGAMDPILTAWIVNIVFTIAAIFNILRVKQ